MNKFVGERVSLGSRLDCDAIIKFGVYISTNQKYPSLHRSIVYHTGKVRSLGGGEALDRLFVLFMFHVFRFMARKSDMKMSFVETKQLKCTIVLFCPNS